MTLETLTSLPRYGGPRPREALLPGSGARERGLSREGGPELADASGSGRRGDCPVGDAGRRWNAGAGLDPVLRSGSRPVFLVAPRQRGSRMTGLPVRVMVEDSWDQVVLDLAAQHDHRRCQAAGPCADTYRSRCERLPRQVSRGGDSGRDAEPRKRRDRSQRRADRDATATPAGPLNGIPPWMTPRCGAE